MVERRGNEPVIERNGAKIAGPDTLGQRVQACVPTESGLKENYYLI